MAQQSNNKLWLSLGVALVAVLVLLFVFVGMSDKTAQADKPNASAADKISRQESGSSNQKAPDFTLTTLNGDDITLSDYRGKVVFLNFWATWCPPCRVEIPHFVDFMEEYEDFIVLGIALDPREFDKVPAFVDKMGINYPVMLDKKGVSQNQYGPIRSIPTTFVINRDGEIVQKIVGSRPKEAFEKIIKNYL